MQVGVIDLGPLGAHVVRRLLAAGHDCVIYDDCARRVAELAAEKAYGAASVADLVHELDVPRVIWLAGPRAFVDARVDQLRRHLAAGDTIVNCAHSSYVEDVARAALLAEVRIQYVDVGVAGTINGSNQGCCLTIGGKKRVVRHLDPLFRELAGHTTHPAERDSRGTASRGYLHCGPAGAGHFVKMIHDVIERCLTAAYAEGFSVLRAANAEGQARSADVPPAPGDDAAHVSYDFNLPEIAEVWRHGSMVASAALDAAARSLPADVRLLGAASVNGELYDEWKAIPVTVREAVSIPVLTSAMQVAAGAPERDPFSQTLLATVNADRGMLRVDTK